MYLIDTATEDESVGLNGTRYSAVIRRHGQPGWIFRFQVGESVEFVRQCQRNLTSSLFA